MEATFQSGRPIGQAPYDIGRGFGTLTSGDWVSHAWVEDGHRLIDITADQFDRTPVVLTSIKDPAYRSGDCAECRLTPTAAGIAAVEELWSVWWESSDRERLLTRPTAHT